MRPGRSASCPMLVNGQRLRNPFFLSMQWEQVALESLAPVLEHTPSGRSSACARPVAEPVLLIKTAWGGRSLHTEFRPPSAGPYELNDYQKKLYYGPPGHGVPKDMEAWLAEKKRETGCFHRSMIEHAKSVLADPKRVCLFYDAAA